MSKNATLVNHLEQLADAAKAFTNGLIAQVLQAVVEAQQEIVEIKADKPQAVSFTIPTSGWTQGTGAFPYYYDKTVADVTAKDRADININPDSMTAAASCGLCPTSETLEGKIRLRAARIPTESIAAEYWVYTGKE